MPVTGSSPAASWRRASRSNKPCAAGLSTPAACAQEEIGITIEDCQPWQTERIDYPHACVQLNFCKVTRWQGSLQMREGQQFAWQQLPVGVQPVLPGTVPVLQWFAQERGFVGPTHSDAGA